MAKRVRSFETDELGPAKSDSKPKPELELTRVSTDSALATWFRGPREAKLHELIREEFVE
jgi:hypothetical protein